MLLFILMYHWLSIFPPTQYERLIRTIFLYYTEMLHLTLYWWSGNFDVTFHINKTPLFLKPARILLKIQQNIIIENNLTNDYRKLNATEWCLHSPWNNNRNCMKTLLPYNSTNYNKASQRERQRDAYEVTADSFNNNNTTSNCSLFTNSNIARELSKIAIVEKFNYSIVIII